LIADYWLIRKKNLKLADLYREKGIFSFEEKTNPLDKLSVILFFGIFGFFLHSLLDMKLRIGQITGSTANIIVLLVIIVVFAFLGFVLTKKGANWRACLATLMGCFFAWIGLIFEPLKILYDYAWFVGFGVSFSVYWLLMSAFPAEEVLATDKDLAAEEVSVADDAEFNDADSEIEDDSTKV